MATGTLALEEPGFITEKNIEHSKHPGMPKYDETTGRELGSMGRFLRGDWVRMPHPHNLVWILFRLYLDTSHIICSLASTRCP